MDTPNLQLLPSTDAEDTIKLKWEAESGVTYFVQSSENLINWDFLPILEQGQGRSAAWGVQANAEKLFFRLSYTDMLPYGEDPYNYDFDGDGVSNIDEIRVGTDPLSNADLNNNGISDDWEFKYSIISISVDADGDGLNALQEFLNGSSPEDYYNGVLPNFDQVSSEADTITTRVTSKLDGSPLVNAPVGYRATHGGHKLSASVDGEKLDSLTIYTDINGHAKVYLVAP